LRVVHGITQAMMRRNLGPSSPNWSHTWHECTEIKIDLFSIQVHIRNLAL
jgi:hypothetical protein